ncbi:MAG TPA: thiamine pyrophosphate-binding protein, partial [Gaiellaceae bacterium]|nr:thiamine pyrophosphate-binding protein [Gaiellaceae bacterium]
MTYGSDVVVSLLREAGVEYVAFNPGATFRGIHDSLVQAGEPRIVLCTHEGVAVALAHGYAKAAGRAMAALLHDVVGLQHGSMAIYNAWCDRVPLLALGGTGPMSTPARRPWIDWIHTALVQGNLVRDYVKWDDQPADLESVPDAFWRAWTTAHAAPRGPVYLCLDAGLQEDAAPDGLDLGTAAEHPVPTPPAPELRELGRLAAELAGAELPVLLTDYAGDSEEGFRALRELAELLHAPVVDCGRRFSFPAQHELNFTGLEEVLDDTDLVACLDVEEPAEQLTGRRAHRVAIVSPAHLRLRSWAQGFGPLVRGAVTITASPETALPALCEAVRAHGVAGPAREERVRRLA